MVLAGGYEDDKVTMSVRFSGRNRKKVEWSVFIRSKPTNYLSVFTPLGDLKTKVLNML